MENNIYLIGMRGVGKTSVGELLAAKLEMPFFDTDEEITKKEKKTIRQLVDEKGWNYFRLSEKKMVQNLSKKKKCIVSTGGGILSFFDNAEILKKTGVLILLIASPKILFTRLQDLDDRPPLYNVHLQNEIRLLWKERKKTYYQYADLIINIEKKNPQKIVDHIIKKIRIV